jgi:hypothetical protein
VRRETDAPVLRRDLQAAPTLQNGDIRLRASSNTPMQKISTARVGTD